MKYALYDFFDENTIEIGLSEFIVGKDPKSFDNGLWVFGDTVRVNWPRNGKKGGEITKCVARVKKFSGRSRSSIIIFIYVLENL